METHRLVLPQDLNQYGFLFGGKLLSWVDEASFIAASLEFPFCKFVTIGMEKSSFYHSVKEGAIICIRCQREKVGNTSVTYLVEVFRGKPLDNQCIFSTRVTFVNINDAGEKIQIILNN